jgi:hypothetical protein
MRMGMGGEGDAKEGVEVWAIFEVRMMDNGRWLMGGG